MKKPYVRSGSRSESGSGISIYGFRGAAREDRAITSRVWNQSFFLESF